MDENNEWSSGTNIFLKEETFSWKSKQVKFKYLSSTQKFTVERIIGIVVNVQFKLGVE